MMLFHASIDALGGFYRSDVYVAANGVNHAREKAACAIMDWAKAQLADGLWLHADVSLDPSDDDFGKEFAAWFDRVQAEIESKLREVPTGAIVEKTI